MINCHIISLDSLLYEIKGADIYPVISQHKEEFDLSEYPDTHSIFAGLSPGDVDKLRGENKKVVGKFKDELSGIPLGEFCGCAPKCYSLQFTGRVKDNRIIDTDQHEKPTAKGTKSRVKDKFLVHELYREVVLRGEMISVKQNTIRSINQQLGTYHQTRLSLTPFDNKRYILEDGIRTRALGHYRNKNHTESDEGIDREADITTGDPDTEAVEGIVWDNFEGIDREADIATGDLDTVAVEGIVWDGDDFEGVDLEGDDMESSDAYEVDMVVERL